MKRPMIILLAVLVLVSVSGCRKKADADAVPLEELPIEEADDEAQQETEVEEESTEEVTQSTKLTEETEESTEEDSGELDSTSIFEMVYPMDYCSELNIIETPDNGLKISYMSDEPLWDETDFVKKSFSHYLDYCTFIYETYDYNSVYTTVFVHDPDGQKLNGLTMMMTRDAFINNEWPTGKDETFYDQFVSACETYDLNPVFGKYIEPEKVKYQRGSAILKSS